jgi:hypothetical protein
MKRQKSLRVLLAAACLCVASAVHAQTPAPDQRWSVDVGMGWDNSISGNINSGGTGTLDGQAVVILKNRYEDVYGTGLHFRFGAGYMYSDVTELRATLTIQSLDADLTEMGDLGVSRLFGQYDDYQSWGVDFGVRRYTGLGALLRAYVDGSFGFASIDEIDVELVAPQANFAGHATDFYDQTFAFALGGNGGVIWQATDQVGLFAQLGLRYTTGLSEIDDLEGTGLETINDSSARWTFPFVLGTRMRF